MLLGELETVHLGRLRRVPADCLVEYVDRLRREQNHEPDEPVGE